MTYIKRDSIGRLSFILFAFYLAQWISPLKWYELIDLQKNDDDFKFWSGLVLILLFSSQWILTYVRVILQKQGKAFYKTLRIHKLTGAFSPVVYFVHSADPDYGFLLILTTVFLLNQLVASINLDRLTIRQYNVWTALHIFFSSSLMVLAISHIVLIFQYK